MPSQHVAHTRNQACRHIAECLDHRTTKPPRDNVVRGLV